MNNYGGNKKSRCMLLKFTITIRFVNIQYSRGNRDISFTTNIDGANKLIPLVTTPYLPIKTTQTLLSLEFRCCSP